MPDHPGEQIKAIITSLALTISEAARQLDIPRVTLTRVIHGQHPVNAAIALRLQAWLGKPTAAHWMKCQAQYDLWREKQKPRPAVIPANIRRYRSDITAAIHQASEADYQAGRLPAKHMRQIDRICLYRPYPKRSAAN